MKWLHTMYLLSVGESDLFFPDIFITEMKPEITIAYASNNI